MEYTGPVDAKIPCLLFVEARYLLSFFSLRGQFIILGHTHTHAHRIVMHAPVAKKEAVHKFG